MKNCLKQLSVLLININNIKNKNKISKIDIEIRIYFS